MGLLSIIPHIFLAGPPKSSNIGQSELLNASDVLGELRIISDCKMSSFVKQSVNLQLAIWLFTSSVAGVARFTNPPGPDGALSLNIGEQYTIEWENAGNDYPEISLGLLAEAGDNVFWLLCKIMFTSIVFRIGANLNSECYELHISKLPMESHHPWERHHSCSRPYLQLRSREWDQLWRTSPQRSTPH